MIHFNEAQTFLIILNLIIIFFAVCVVYKYGNKSVRCLAVGIMTMMFAIILTFTKKLLEQT
jgi:hypothetical protein